MGRVRKDNQDSGYAGPWLLAVCDGVGGAARGDIASQHRDRAAPQARRAARRTTTCSAGRRRAAPRRTTGSASSSRRTPTLERHQHHRHRRALRRPPARHRPRRRQPRPTSSATARSASSPTTTRSCRRLIDEGRITEEEARIHPHRNLILQGARRRPRDRARPVPRRAGAPATGCCCAATAPAASLDRRPARRHPLHRHPRLRRGRAGPRQPRGRQHRQRHLPGRRRRSTRPPRSTTPCSRCWSAPPPSCRRKAIRGHRAAGFFRGHRAGDTGELEPIGADDPRRRAVRHRDRPVDPEHARYAPRPPRRASSGCAACCALAVVARRRRDRRRPRPSRGPSSSTTSASRTAWSPSSAASTPTLPGLRALAAVPEHQRHRQPAGSPTSTPTQVTRGHRLRQPRRAPGAPSRTCTRSQAVPGVGARRMSVAMQQPAALMGFVHRRRRGAELFLLVLALAVGIGAYAAVGLGVAGRGARRHRRVRRLAGRADHRRATSWSGSSRRTPTRCCCRSWPPSTGSAWRSSTASTWPPGRRARTHGFARQQLIWMTLGVLLFVATLVLLRDHRVLQRVHLHLRAGRDRAAAAADGARASAATINGARIWIHVGPFSFQPGEVAKVLLVIAFAGYLVLHRDALALAGRRVLFVDLPRGRDLGPILAMWLIRLGILVFQRDLGSVAAVLRPVPGDALRRHRAARAGWSSAAALFAGRRLRWRYRALRPRRPASTSGSTRSTTTAQGTATAAGQIVEAMFGMAWGGLLGRGFGERQPRADPLRRVRLHHRRRSARSSA